MMLLSPKKTSVTKRLYLSTSCRPPSRSQRALTRTTLYQTSVHKTMTLLILKTILPTPNLNSVTHYPLPSRPQREIHKTISYQTSALKTLMSLTPKLISPVPNPNSDTSSFLASSLQRVSTRIISFHNSVLITRFSLLKATSPRLRLNSDLPGAKITLNKPPPITLATTMLLFKLHLT